MKLRPSLAVNGFAALLCAIAFSTSVQAQPSPGSAAPPEVIATTVAATPAPNPRKFSPAFAGRLDDMRLVPDDYWAGGKLGDTILRNDRASLVFGAVPENMQHSDQERAGILMDIFPGARSQEHFWRTFIVFDNANVQQLRTTKMSSSTDPEKGTATVTVEQVTDRIPGLRFTTEYTMWPETPGALATTYVQNDSNATITLPILGDAVYWGVMGPFIPSVGWSMAGAVNADAEFIYGRQYDSYVFMMPKDLPMMKAVHDKLVTRLVYSEKVDIPAGTEDSFSRWIMASSETPTALMGEVLSRREGQPYGILSGKLIERARTAGGDVIDRGVVANCNILLRVAKRPEVPLEYVGRPYIMTKTDSNGRWAAALPPGEYGVRADPVSRLYQPGGFAEVVKKGETKTIEEATSPAAVLSYEVVDKETQLPIPAKISVVPLRGARLPQLGRLGELTAEGSVYAATGRGTVELPTGAYRIVASHGNEYDVAEQRIQFNEARTDAMRFELRRAFKPDGWVSADLAVRTNASPDVRTTAEDRVVTAAAEGLQWIASADMGALTDLGPAITRMGLTDRLKASIGYRTLAESEPLPGDILVVPADGKTLEQIKAAQGKTPAETLKSLKGMFADSLTLLMRPADPDFSALKLSGGDAKLAYVPKENPPTDFDGIQVWDGKHEEGFQLGYSSYMEYLSRGFRRTAFAASASGGTYGAEPGYPRMYIKSSTTDTTKIDPKELIQNFKLGLVQVTNGPLIEYTIDGKSPGEIVQAKSPKAGDPKRVTVDLKVFAPNWAAISRISVQQNGRFSKQIYLPGTPPVEGGLIYPAAGSTEQGQFFLLISRDTVVDVMVESDPGIVQDPVNPRVVAAPGVQQGQRTLAVSAPIFIDWDGDGKITLPPYMEMRAPAQMELPEDFQPPF